jgi:hypothetical protein
VKNGRCFSARFYLDQSPIHRPAVVIKPLKLKEGGGNQAGSSKLKHLLRSGLLPESFNFRFGDFNSANATCKDTP